MNRYILKTTICLIAVAGCRDAVKSPARQNDSPAIVANVADRDAEIIRYVLAEHDDRPEGRVYFLTVTPMDDWTERGDWQELPQSFHDSIASLNTKYRRAHEAYLKDGRVLVKGTDAEAWMRWITVKRWISETEVELEDGVWCCPLGGGASTTTYEKIDGKWQLKSSGKAWVS